MVAVIVNLLIYQYNLIQKIKDNPQIINIQIQQQVSLMQKFINLCENITLFNSISQQSFVLNYPNILILCSKKVSPQTSQLILLLTAKEPLVITSNNLIASNQHKIITSKNLNVKCNIYLLENLGCGNVKDSDYRYKRKFISKFNKLLETIYIVILDESQLKSNHLGVHLVQQFDPQRLRSIVVQRYRGQFILDRVRALYLNCIKIKIVTAYRQLLKIKYQLSCKMQQMEQFLLDLNINDNPIKLYEYLYKQHQFFLTGIISQLQGNFISTRQFKIKTPLKCIIMSRLQQVWEDDYYQIVKRVESVSLKQIQEQLMFYNTELMHGFLSGNCFKNMFHPYMTQLQQSINQTLKQIVEIILITIEHMINHSFRYLSVKQSYSSMLLQEISPLCSRFLSEIQIFIHSQIQYIYISDQKYWKINGVNTSLYANSTYIQIKYIGISYIRRLAESLQQILPKMIGDRLIDVIVKHIKRQSLLLLQQLIGIQHVSFNLPSQQREKQLQISSKYESVQKVMNYFTSFIDPISLIPDVKSKINFMFNSYKPKDDENQIEKNIEKKGFFQKIKNIFLRRKVKRSSSQDKQIKVQKDQYIQEKPINQNIIRQTEWLIAINTHKQLSYQRMVQSSKIGFPPFLRVSIWVYISSLNSVAPNLKQLLQNVDTSSQTYHQIQRDIDRTPPPELFAFNESAQIIMREVLLAYSIYNPAVGYVQGMNFIVSMIVRTIINYGQKDYAYILKKHQNNNFTIIEQQVLTILNYIIKKLKWEAFFINGTPRVFSFSLQLQDKIKSQVPSVWSKIQELEMSSFLIFTEGIMTVLTAKTPLHMSQRIFDCFLLKGQDLISDVIIRLLKLNESTIKQMNSVDELFLFLREGIYKCTISLIGIQEILSS